MTRRYECIKRFSWTPENIHTLKRMSKSNTQEEAAKALGCSIYTVINGCKQHGVSFRKKGGRHYSSKLTFDDVELIRTLKEEGLKQCVIAEKFEVSTTLISRIVNYQDRLTC